MSDSALVRIAVEGLAFLNDGDSIGLIAQACGRFSPDRAEALAFFATSYQDPRVDELFVRFITDPAALARTRKEWQAKRQPSAVPKQ
jgi:hypothetical protein